MTRERVGLPRSDEASYEEVSGTVISVVIQHLPVLRFPSGKERSVQHYRYKNPPRRLIAS